MEINKSENAFQFEKKKPCRWFFLRAFVARAPTSEDETRDVRLDMYSIVRRRAGGCGGDGATAADAPDIAEVSADAFQRDPFAAYEWDD